MLTDLLAGLGSGLVFAVIGLVLMALGYRVVDTLTPGNLGDLVYVQRNRNAALLVSSGALAVGAIVTTAIATSADDFLLGVVEAAGYGLLGVLLLGLAFLLVDALTPGKLGEIVTDDVPHPAVYVSVATHIAVGAIVAAAIA